MQKTLTSRSHPPELYVDMNHKQELAQLLEGIERRPTMFFRDDGSLEKLLVYVQGIFQGMQLATGENLERELSEWYQERSPARAKGVLWFYQFASDYPDMPDPERRKLFFELLQEFLNA